MTLSIKKKKEGRNSFWYMIFVASRHTIYKRFIDILLFYYDLCLST